MQYIIRVQEISKANHIIKFVFQNFSGFNPQKNIQENTDGEQPVYFIELKKNFTLEEAKHILFNFAATFAMDIPQAVRFAKQIMQHQELIWDDFTAVIIPVE